MSRKLQEFSQKPFALFLKKLIGDPVQLYAVFLMTTIMYYYHSSLTSVYTIIAIGISWLLMRFYDFVARHKWIGPLTYFVYMLAGLEIVRLLTEQGQKKYPISFMVWFLTPQSVVTFSIWYTISIYLLMLGFLTSAVYYFSKTRYRMSMQFLIMLIPMSLYAKEGIHMPAILVIILLASYFLLMIYCRQMNNPNEIRYLPSFHGRMSIAVYVIVFSVISAIFPKPEIQADREFIDNAMSYSTWSDTLMNAISMFTDTTTNSLSASNNSRTIYYASSMESLRLRTQTYSYYKSDDSWNVIRDYDYPDQQYPATGMTYCPKDVLQAILDTASLSDEFTKKYHLEDVKDTTLLNQELRTFSICPLYYPMRTLPAPTRIYFTPTGFSMTVSKTGTFAGNQQDWAMIQYYSDTYANYASVMPILQKLSGADYPALLEDAQAILKDSSPEQAKLLKTVQEECQDAYQYLEEAHQEDFQSDVIQQLAEQITAGLTSDYDKAKAIEKYFINENFVYDQYYQKPNGTNAEYFLTKSKIGVCYEYATAMVLLCRSIGLPARYVQGYNLNEMYETNFRNKECNYLIKVRDSHAFPEVYISGYGWLSFEPTVPSNEILEDGRAENQIVMQWGFFLLILAFLAGGFYFLLPRIQEALFRRKLRRLSPSACASAVFRRMRSLLHLPDSTTVQELAQKSAIFYVETALFDALDVLLYQIPQQSEPSILLAESYQNWADARTQYLKEQAQKRKQERKKKNLKAENA